MKTAALRRLEPTHADAQRTTAGSERPLRFLLITDRGEMPWAAHMLVRVMAPVDVVQVTTLANALWRLGRERFDSVLLHFEASDPQIAAACRRQIADAAALPVLDLNDDDAQSPEAGVASRPRSEAPAQEHRRSRRPLSVARRRGRRAPAAQDLD